MKIMYRRSLWFVSLTIARSEMEREAAARGRMSLTGFVAYMKRKDAETAVQELDGAEWGHAKLKVGFSKWVPIPAKALYGKSRRQLLLSTQISRHTRNALAHGRQSVTEPGRLERAALPALMHEVGHVERPQDRLNAEEGLDRSRIHPILARHLPIEHLKRTKPGSVGLIRLQKIRQSLSEPSSRRSRTREGALRTCSWIAKRIIRISPFSSTKQWAFYQTDADTQLPGYHLYLSLLSSRYRIPTPPPEGFDDEVRWACV